MPATTISAADDLDKISTKNSRHPKLSLKAAAAIGLVALADFLLYGHQLGISIALLALAVVAVIAVLNPRFSTRLKGLAAVAFAVIGIIPVTEDIHAISIGFALASVAYFAIAARGHRAVDPIRRGLNIAALYLLAPVRLVSDAMLLVRASARTSFKARSTSRVRTWALPLISSVVFAALFAQANPIISSWLDGPSIWDLIGVPAPLHAIFWLAGAAVFWSLLRPHIWAKRPAGNSAVTAPDDSTLSLADIWFSKAAVLRSLVLFNIIFLAQTFLDAVYLWGGKALPAGLTYASYAHRGAYPLIGAAVLAALFVLIALRPASESSRSRTVRTLVYAWLAQTIMLVVSSIWRTSLYVSIYSLTYLRVAAVIWMVLIALGLFWILLSIARQKSHNWLYLANFYTLVAVLYACCFVDFGSRIAWFNVQHAKQVSGAGQLLDVNYIRSIGPAAVPALEWYKTQTKSLSSSEWLKAHRATKRLRHGLHRQLWNWRGFTYRDYRLGCALKIITKTGYVHQPPSLWMYP